MNASMTRKIVIGVLAAAVVGGGTWWAVTPKKMSAEERYVTATVERGPITQTVSANGTLNPVVLVSVGSQVSGIVQDLYADFNDKVKAGQVLLKLNPALSRAQLEQSEANLASAMASLQLARANEQRNRDLYAKEYVTRQDMDTSVQALKAAEAQVALVKAQVARDQTNLNYTIIRSPVSGVVVSRDVDVGQTVAASFQTPTLFKIAQDLSKMQIDSSYAEADVGNIRIGQPAEFRVDAYPNRTFHGVVHQVRLNPTTQQNVVTYDVVVSVDNPDKVLVPNAALRFHPVEATKKGSTARGNDSGQDGGGIGGVVYVLKDGQPSAVHVGIGISDNRMSEVLDGNLKPGDKVIVSDRQAAAGASGSRHMGLF
jgi:HlyD family secretion protein